jgi:hypothetical protein
MKIKRAFYAMLVLLLLPLTVMAQPVAPTIPTPAMGTAVIAVSKFFDNSAQRFGEVGLPVTIMMQCDGGSVSPNTAVDVYPEFGKYETSFVVYNLGPEQTTNCKIWEEPIEGYTASYDCNFGAYYGYYGAGPDIDCDGDEDGPSDMYCEFDTISANTSDGETPSEGSQAGCTIFNDVDAVEIEVTKVWEVFGQPGANFSQGVDLTLVCDARIAGGYWRKGKWKKRFDIGNHGFSDGVATITAAVYPEWYPEEDDETTMCSWYEDNVASAVEVDNDCMDLSIAIGSSGVECTITNTMFFEGIPTLNQYGMAILALLMLGVGFVGFRRFV